MFEKLKKKWGVSGIRLGLIIATFAIGGSLTGFVAKKIMNLLSINEDWLWGTIYILIVTVLWPVGVLVVSIVTGQFSFFKKYIQKIGQKFSGKKKADSL